MAFDVKIERDAQELADSLGVNIFQADIIYHLFDKFTAYREELKQKKREEFRSIAVFPCKLKVCFDFYILLFSIIIIYFFRILLCVSIFIELAKLFKKTQTLQNKNTIAIATAIP